MFVELTFFLADPLFGNHSLYSEKKSSVCVVWREYISVTFRPQIALCRESVGTLLQSELLFSATSCAQYILFSNIIATTVILWAQHFNGSLPRSINFVANTQAEWDRSATLTTKRSFHRPWGIKEDDLKSEKLSDAPLEGSCCGGQTEPLEYHKQDRSMNASSSADHIPGVSSTACSRRRKGDADPPMPDLEIPEGSTPCCQNALWKAKTKNYGSC